MRCPVSDSIQGRSSAATKCNVPRIGQERTNAPVSCAASILLRVEDAVRSPIDHRPPA